MKPKMVIQADLSARFPELQVFHLRVTGLRAAKSLGELAQQRLDEAASYVASALPTTEALLAHPLVATWRDAYRAMGVKPSAFRCSFEALARRAIAGKDLRTGLAAVDLYNACSLQHTSCLGAFDVAKLTSALVELRLCEPGGDRFVPLGGRPDDFPLGDKLVIYGQDNQVLCWGFNCRDSALSCLDASSDEVLFMTEAVSEAQAEAAERGLASLRSDLASISVQVSDVVAVTPT